ncbi:CG10822, partial [Drosophila busckii]
MYAEVAICFIMSLWLLTSCSNVVADTDNMDLILDLLGSNSSYSWEANKADSMLVPPYLYPYILIGLWLTCVCSVICCCLYCKCKQETTRMTSFKTNSFELQEVHVVEHPLPHVKGCVCLGCLQ